jgi:branched-subunit amino acid transport protein AzlD
MPVVNRNNRWQTCFSSATSAGLVSVLAVAVGYPLDSILNYICVMGPKSVSSIISPLKNRSTLPGANALTRGLPVISALYAGLPLNIVAYFCFNFCFFALVEFVAFPFMKHIKQRYPKFASLADKVLPQMASLIATLIPYPLDTIRRAQQIHALNGGSLSLIAAAQLIYDRRGLTGFFAGASLNSARIIFDYIMSFPITYLLGKKKN